MQYLPYVIFHSKCWEYEKRISILMEFIPVETETDSQQIKDQLDSLIVFQNRIEFVIYFHI